jgi:acyl-CoA thioester hydrolase
MPNTFSYLSQVYFDELDGLGLLHHTRYLLHLERAQQNFFEQLLGVDGFNAERDEDIYVVVRSLTARFRQPVSNPGPILINYTIQKIRSGGVTMGYIICCPETGTVYCEGERTVCKLSATSHQPSPWSEPFRAAMETFQSAS